MQRYVLLILLCAQTLFSEEIMRADSVYFNDQEFIALLEKFINHSEQLQNNPPEGLLPEEILIVNEIKNYIGNTPGISLETHNFDPQEKRPNLIMRYKHPEAITSGKTITFMGSHMDVVPANRNEWEKNPFILHQEIVDNDLKLIGRGTTDCLGHVALITVLFKQLATQSIKLSHELVAVFIADEERGDAKVGVFRLHEHKLLEDIKNGPIYWVDTATDDGLFGPRVGTGGSGAWSITIHGKSGHSGYPHLSINPISVAVDLIGFINKRFERDFCNESAQHYARAHLYPTCSTCKCTTIAAPTPSRNIIPNSCSFSGDVRFTPDVSEEKIKKTLPTYIEEFNNEHIVSSLSPSLRADGGTFIVQTHNDQTQKAIIEFNWDETFYKPFIADMNSPAFTNMIQAMKEIRKKVQPFSALGSLPLLYELQEEGFSLVPIGFGRQKAYHAPNEFCMLSEMADGYRVLLKTIELFEEQNLQKDF